jgi:hypothetical protein
MTQSEPSNTALATSVASARVGRGFWIIDSSICVAVMTGLPTTWKEDGELVERQWTQHECKWAVPTELHLVIIIF